MCAYLSNKGDIRADHTITNVPRTRLFGWIFSSGEGKTSSAAQLWPSRNVFITRDRIDKDLPIPISSARIPPPNSVGASDDLALVILCTYLWRCQRMWNEGMHCGSYFFCPSISVSSQREYLSGTGPTSRCIIKYSAFFWCLDSSQFC